MRMKPCQVLAWIAFGLGLQFQVQAKSQPLEPISMGCWMRAETRQAQGLMLLYHQAFANLGYRLQMHYLPSARIRVMLEDGQLDGDCARQPFFAQELASPELVVRVPEPAGATTVSLWAQPEFTSAAIDWQQAEQERWLVVFEQGTDIAKYHLDHYPQELQMPVPSQCHGLRMLAQGHAQLLLAIDFALEYDMAASVEDCPRAQAVQPLVHLEAFPFLHRSKAFLAEPLARELRHLTCLAAATAQDCEQP